MIIEKFSVKVSLVLTRKLHEFDPTIEVKDNNHKRIIRDKQVDEFYIFLV